MAQTAPHAPSKEHDMPKTPPAARTPTRTHTAPFTGATHRGTPAACTEYPCAPNREAVAYLREGDVRTGPEQAALDIVRDKAWVLWHADDRDLGVLLVLSRAGLLRDLDQEKREQETALAMARIAKRERKAEATARIHLDALAEQAADRLDAGDDPKKVAEWMRECRAEVEARRERGRSAITADVTA